MPIRYDPTPPPSWGEAKRIIALILAEAGGELRQKTRLYKAFFKAHQEHWINHNGVLTTHPVVAMPHGPGVDAGDMLIEEMENEGVIRVTPPPPNSKKGFDFRLLKPDYAIGTDDERDSIRRALAWVAGRGAVWLSEETHITSRSWKNAKMSGQFGREIDLYLDLIPEGEYQRMGKAIEDQRRKLESIFGCEP